MMKSNSGLANKGIDRILELSAEAHAIKGKTVKDSPEFHNLTGAIAAYGKALAILAAMQRREEFYAMLNQRVASEYMAGLFGGKEQKGLDTYVA